MNRVNTTIKKVQQYDTKLIVQSPSVYPFSLIGVSSYEL